MSLQHPVVCEQIGERSLYLGSARAASEGVVDEKFRHVVTLSSTKQSLTTSFIPLVDGSELEYSQFREAVDLTRRYYRQRGPVLVHCEVGISRSAAVIATVIAIEDGLSFEKALEEIKRYRGRASPRRPLRKSAKRYLQEHSGKQIPLHQ